MEQKFYNQLGIWAGQQLVALGWEKKDLAKKIGVKQPYLSNILSGKQPGAMYVDKIIRVIMEALTEQEKQINPLKEVV